MEFSLAHKTYCFPEEAILCYKWLSSMFGFSNIGEPKEKLLYNLKEYLPEEIEMYIVREMIEALDCLQLYYSSNSNSNSNRNNNSNTDKDENAITDFDSNKMRMTEYFLSNGPGATKGLDIPFECTTCHAQELRPEIIEYTVKKHELEQVSQTTLLCLNCGVLFSTLSNYELQKPIYCYIPLATCRHIWE
jgi:hypothetical protein|tara:strand:+ start:1013 stop:1582 length:570 start_codon:yes stop_codon:yes gene_type:complete